MSASPPILGQLSSLADETRGRLLLLLEGSEYTVSELCQVLQLPQPTVSRHLGFLLRDGWVTMRAEGSSRHYRMAPPTRPEVQGLWEVIRGPLAKGALAAEDRWRSRAVLEARAERSRAFFATEAGSWEGVRRELLGERAELQLLAALLEGSEIVGDLGCGTGTLTRLLAPFAARVIGVDRSSEMLEIAGERTAGLPNVDLRQGDFSRLPVEDGVLDIALLSLVLSYLPDPRAALREVGRVLRPGGRLLLLDLLSHRREGYRETLGHLWLGFGEGELLVWLDEAGFEAPTRVDLLPVPTAAGPLLFALRANRRALPSTG